MSQRVVCQFSKAEICNLFPRLIASKYRIKRLGGALYSVLQIDLGLEGVVQENVCRLDVPVYDPRMACMYVQDQLLISRTDKQASYPGRTGASHDELVRPHLQSSWRYVNPRAAPIAIFIRFDQSITGSPFPADRYTCIIQHSHIHAYACPPMQEEADYNM